MKKDFFNILDKIKLDILKTYYSNRFIFTLLSILLLINLICLFKPSTVNNYITLEKEEVAKVLHSELKEAKTSKSHKYEAGTCLVLESLLNKTYEAWEDKEKDILHHCVAEVGKENYRIISFVKGYTNTVADTESFSRIDENYVPIDCQDFDCGSYK